MADKRSSDDQKDPDGKTTLKSPEQNPVIKFLENFRPLLHNLPIGLSILRQDGTFEYFNLMFTKIFGYDIADIPDKQTWFLKAYPDAIYRDQAKRAWHADLLKLESTDYMERIFKVRCKSGRDKSIYLRNIRLDEQRQCMTYADLTEKKDLEEQLFQAQKMEAIGTLAGGIAHDFNNILAAIFGYTEIALLKAPADSEISRYLHLIFKASQRARDLVMQILSFSRKKEEKSQAVRMASIVKEAIKLLRASLPATIELSASIAPECGAVKASPTQIHQIVMNLCTNAAHAMDRDPGIIEVCLKEVEVTDHSRESLPGITPGIYLVLSVGDTGYGISREIKGKIFEPYFTTRAKSTGTGLGLSVVHGIVKNYNGAVFVQSSPGKGALFSVYLPKVETAVIGTTEPARQLPRGKEHILLVDDEPDIADIGRQLLEYLGYRVTVATESKKAIALFAERPDHFDLVISDLTMPRIPGDVLARKILGIRPGTPVILCSGFSERFTTEEAKAIGIKQFITKPVDLGTLARTVREVLDGDRGYLKKRILV